MSGTRVNTVSTGRGVAELETAGRATPLRRNFPESARTRVVRISETTATYDDRGTYPSKRNFQVTKPMPARPAFGTLVSDIPPETARHMFSASYLRDRPLEPQYVDALL